MSETRLIIGMPAGSLADATRGGSLVNLLKAAGFPSKGYDQGGPTSFPLNTVFMGWDGRPQEFGAQLAIGEIDIAIGGDDWVRERVLEFKYEYKQDIQLEKILSLERGQVRLVIIMKPLAKGQTFDQWLSDLLRRKPLVTMVSEMPYLALDWFEKKIAALGFADTHAEFSV
jgi:ATP phosphoribosyltransferase